MCDFEEWLVKEYRQPVYQLVYRLLADTEAASDTTRNVFAEVFHGMKHFQDGVNLKNWIFRIAVREASRTFRWSFRESVHGDGLEAGLRQLSMPLRTVVVLRDMELMSYEEISEITGASMGTVKSRLARGRASLQTKMEETARLLELQQAL